MEQPPTAAEYAFAAAQDAHRIAEHTREEARIAALRGAIHQEPVRADLGFTAYGNVVTAASGLGDRVSGSIAVSVVHQVTLLLVCTRCGAAVPLPYQERHAEWHEELRRVLRFLELRADGIDGAGNPDFASDEL